MATRWHTETPAAVKEPESMWSSLTLQFLGRFVLADNANLSDWIQFILDQGVTWGHQGDRASMQHLAVWMFACCDQ